MRKILFISYAFPPQGGVGVQRTVKFLKYLPLYGYTPYVVTAKKRFYDFKDEELINQIDKNKVKIYDIFSFEPENYIDKFSFKNFSFKLLYHKIVRNFFRFFDFVFTPDEKVFWMTPCILSAASLVLKENIDCIYVTGDPFSSFIAGYYISKLTRKPLVLDFRDEWISGYLLKDARKRFKWHAGFEKMMEKKVISRASKVISVTPAIIENFIKKYPEHKEKFICIPNGFDEDDFYDIQFTSPLRGEGSAPFSSPLRGDGSTSFTSPLRGEGRVRGEDKFTILHSGKVYGLRNPVVFLTALKEIKKENKEIFNKIKVVFAGAIDGSMKKEIDDVGINEIIKFKGFVKHNEIIRLYKEADLNLLILDKDEDAKRVYTAKIFEYMASGKDILAIAPSDSSVADLIKKSNTGVLINNYDDIEGIKKDIYKFIEAKQKGIKLFNRNYEFINQFSRKNLTKKLAQTFDGVLLSSPLPLTGRGQGEG